MHRYRFYYWNDDVLAFAFVDAESERAAIVKFNDKYNEPYLNVVQVS